MGKPPGLPWKPERRREKRLGEKRRRERLRLRRQRAAPLFNAVRLGEPVYHNGEWRMAFNESSRTHSEVLLTNQVEIPPGNIRWLLPKK